MSAKIKIIRLYSNIYGFAHSYVRIKFIALFDFFFKQFSHCTADTTTFLLSFN